MKLLKLSLFSLFITVLLLSVSNAQDCEDVEGNPFTNCGFETGDFTSWVTQDLTDPFFDLQVGGAGEDPGEGLFISDPPQGVFAALTGFDGNGPGTIRVAQDIIMPPGSTDLVFEYQCGWSLSDEIGTLPRRFEVNIEESGGGDVLQSNLIVTAEPGSDETPDNGPNQTVTVDVSALSGQAVRVSFDWLVPQNFTGPAFCQLDNVSIAEPLNIVRPIPTLSEWGLIALAGIMGIVGLIVIQRRKVTT